MRCYFQGCSRSGLTKEHIPPKAFFPEDQRNQLLTVKSCKEHNNAKSKDDLYVLAQICMNTSPVNGARDVFLEKVVPQLSFNSDALRSMLAKNSKPQSDGSVIYLVDTARFNSFFDALTCGILFKANGRSVPKHYKMGHIFHNLISYSETEEEMLIREGIDSFYSGEPMQFMNFGDAGAVNTKIYSVKIFGVPDYQGSITVVHEFFGIFKVTSMVSNVIGYGLS